MKKLAITTLALLAIFSLTACGESVAKTSKIEEPNSLTTKDYQNYFNNIVDDNIKFMQDVPKDNNLNRTTKKAESKLNETKKIIEQIEKRESKNEEAKNEVLSLAKGYSDYYGLIANKKVEEATTQITIVLVSVTKVSDKVFSGELPPKWSSMQ
ncbi:exported hypothetical protein [Lactococcus piscium]|nr:exported hypothetical protein [Lactococcus piscium]